MKNKQVNVTNKHNQPNEDYKIQQTNVKQTCRCSNWRFVVQTDVSVFKRTLRSTNRWSHVQTDALMNKQNNDYWN